MRTSFSLAIAIGVLAFLPLSILQAQDPAGAAYTAANNLYNQGNYAEAVKAFEQLLKDYPTSQYVFTGQLNLGFSYYFTSEFDKAIDVLQKLLQNPGMPADLKPVAMSLLPQVISAKATSLPPTDPQRKTFYEDAIKKFGEYLAQFPNTPEAETAAYGQAVAYFQIADYDNAAKTLDANIQKFANSPSILDSQNLLALTYATQGSKLLKYGEDNSAAFALYDKAIQILRDIINKKSDLTLVNAANFQLGEILFNRAGFSEGEEKAALYKEAGEVYRSVSSKDDLVALQDVRVKQFPDRIKIAVQQGNPVAIQALNRDRTRQTEKLMQLKGSPDQVLSALSKVSEIYYNEARYNEARTILNHLQPLLQNENEKKRALYFKTLSYALQNNSEKALAGYNEFQGSYKGDPLAANMPVIIGNMLLAQPGPDAATQAKQYFQESLTTYPDGAYVVPASIGLANAEARLGNMEGALKSYQDLLQKNIKPDEAARAQTGIATIHKDMKQWDTAIADYKTVVEKYPNEKPQVTDAEFWIAVCTQQKGDNAAAIPLLKAFLEKYATEAPYLPNALYTLAAAQVASGDKDAGVASMKELAEKYPDSAPAPFTYLLRANIFASQQKTEEAKTMMREFIAKYPQHEKVYNAYESLAMGAMAETPQNRDEAIRLFGEFAEKYPQAPQAVSSLIKVADLQREKAEALGRYSAVPEAEREQWKASVDASIATGQRIIATYPDSPDLALALQSMLATQRLLLGAQLKTAQEVEQYFQQIANDTSSTSAKSKTLFTLASFIAENDQARALETMQQAYDPAVKYAPADLDFLGVSLIEQNKLDEAEKVFDKMLIDYPVPPGATPQSMDPAVAEAQADMLFGKGRIAQARGQSAEAAQFLEQLKTNYGWSPKVLEATYIIAESKRKTTPDEALQSLVPVIRSTEKNAAPVRAKAMLLCGYIFKDKMEATTDAKQQAEFRANAIDYFLKIAQFYPAMNTEASTGLWEGAQLLEQQAATLTDPKAKERQLQLAKLAYQDLVTKYPNSPYTAQAKERLNALGGTP